MKILQDGIIFSLQTHGGISVYSHELSKNLSFFDIELEQLRFDGLKRFVPQGPHVSVTKACVRTLERYRRCIVPVNQYDIFHSTYYRIPSNRNVAQVVTVHDFIYERYYSGVRKWVHSTQKFAAIKNADVIICVSDSTRDDLLNYCSIRENQKIFVINHGVSDQYFPIDDFNRDSVSKRYILYVGDRRAYKRFNLAARILEFDREIELVCVGGGGLQSADFDQISTSARERVVHAGYVSDEQLNHLYNGAIALVFPSEYEGFGIPVIEAMRAGCPVIANIECDAVRSIGGDALITCEPDSFEMSKQVSWLKVPENRKYHSQNSINWSSKFSWKKTATETYAAYQTALRR